MFITRTLHEHNTIHASCKDVTGFLITVKNILKYFRIKLLRGAHFLSHNKNLPGKIFLVNMAAKLFEGLKRFLFNRNH